ncbi:MAG: antibiotic biosynthesis monooxygenase [Flavobacteriales bacterium]|nr:antibiotic biosynthesis monooxygenase [Flavobacteriales bacterium]
MFTRIVKLTIKQEHISDFESLFERYKNDIRNQKGCKGLRLLHDKNDPRIFFTYSHWQLDADLENYRNSELFAVVWGTTKRYFDAKAEAWSVNEMVTLD